MITITIDGTLSDTDRLVLSALLATEQRAKDPGPSEAPKVATPKVAPKVAPKPEEPEEPEEDPLEDILGTDEDDDEPEPEVTQKDAVAAASKLVSSGASEKVREALASVGAKRVSEVKPGKLAAFVKALEG